MIYNYKTHKHNYTYSISLGVVCIECGYIKQFNNNTNISERYGK